MAIYARGKLELAKQWKERDQTSPERSKVWCQSKPKRVPVVYYLFRNGHFEHPHFMEVSLCSRDNHLYLKDVIGRLNVLRGNGMASMYSWSFKRSYKNGFVWQDLSEDDVIYPSQGNEYVLKGSELLSISPPSPAPQRSASSSSSASEQALETPKIVYKVCRPDQIVDAATQTDDEKPRRRSGADSEEEIEVAIEISPPPSSSSTETLDSLIRTTDGGRLIADQDRQSIEASSGRFRASAVLMQLVSCGSVSVKEGGGATRGRLDSGRKEMDGLIGESSFGPMRFEDIEYFSGSLIEMKKREESGGDVTAGLKRSNSYNADKSSKLGLAAKEIDVARAKCIPRKTKVTSAGRREKSVGVGSMSDQS